MVMSVIGSDGKPMKELAVQGYMWGDGYLIDYARYVIDSSGDNGVMVIFDTPGGSANTGAALYELFRANKEKLSACVIGQCSSAGVLPFLAIPKERRKISKVATMLIHNPMFTSNQLNHHELETTTKDAKALTEQYVEAYSEAIGIPADDVRRIMDEGRSFSASECIALGFASGYIDDESEKNISSTVEMCAEGSPAVVSKIASNFSQAVDIIKNDRERRESEMSAVISAAKSEVETVKAQLSAAIADGLEKQKAADEARAALVDRDARIAEMSKQIDLIKDVKGSGVQVVNETGTKEWYIEHYNSNPETRRLFGGTAEKYAAWMVGKK